MGDGAHRPVVPVVKRLPTPQSADPAFAAQAVTRIVRDRRLLYWGQPGVVQAEVSAQGVAPHGPVESPTELGQVNRCCHGD